MYTLPCATDEFSGGEDGREFPLVYRGHATPGGDGNGIVTSPHASPSPLQPLPPTEHSKRYSDSYISRQSYARMYVNIPGADKTYILHIYYKC